MKPIDIPKGERKSEWDEMSETEKKADAMDWWV